jgi:hypothetical protein
VVAVAPRVLHRLALQLRELHHLVRGKGLLERMR